jgi:excisionase family DNA binding protein
MYTLLIAVGDATASSSANKARRLARIQNRGAEYMPEREIMTVAEVATDLRCSKAHVCKAIRGQVRNVSPLPAIAMGRRKLIRRCALEQWKRENENAQADGIIGESPKIHAVDA